MMNYEAVIGLEVHVQLKTNTKVFCGCANEFGSKENSRICPVCLGLPGSLPVLNADVLKSAVKVALALNAAVRPFIKFDRKNYFYPDLPKNYQISQYDMPIAESGHLSIEVNNVAKRVGIKRVHMEEDAGKLVHEETAPYSLVDYNRAGTPLLEIVTDPDLNTPEEAYTYLSDLKIILQYLGVSDCDMEKGSLRCDANISLKPVGEKKLGIKSELKNMNSFKAVRVALEYEIKRQSALLERGERIVQETRLWDEKKQATVSMRSKEEAHDYRYFPEPDLPPFEFSQDQIEQIRSCLPELPQERFKRFVSDLKLAANAAGVLISDKKLADFFEECLQLYPEAQTIASWVIGPVLSHADLLHPFGSLELSPKKLTDLIRLVDNQTVSQLSAKTVLDEMIQTGKEAGVIIREKDLTQVSGAEELKTIIEDVLISNKKSVEDFLCGKENALMFLVGQVMKKSQGKANPKVAKDLLTERLKKC